MGQEAAGAFPPGGGFSCCGGEILFSPQPEEMLQPWNLEHGALLRGGDALNPREFSPVT